MTFLHHAPPPPHATNKGGLNRPSPSLLGGIGVDVYGELSEAFHHSIPVDLPLIDVSFRGFYGVSSMNSSFWRAFCAKCSPRRLSGEIQLVDSMETPLSDSSQGYNTPFLSIWLRRLITLTLLIFSRTPFQTVANVAPSGLSLTTRSVSTCHGFKNISNPCLPMSNPTG